VLADREAIFRAQEPNKAHEVKGGEISSDAPASSQERFDVLIH